MSLELFLIIFNLFISFICICILIEYYFLFNEYLELLSYYESDVDFYG